MARWQRYRRSPLYREKEVVKRNVPSAQAVDELIALIKEHGMWVDLPTDQEDKVAEGIPGL